MQLPAFFSTYPNLRGLPFCALGRFPTPLRDNAVLSEALGCRVLVKHDELAGERYGGNKVRKLEFLLGDARAKGCDTLLTVGGIGSHHVLATCLYGRAEGFAVRVILFPQPETAHTMRNYKRIQEAATEIIAIPHSIFVPIVLLRERGRPKQYYIAGGGSSSIGSLGYVSAAFELQQQLEEQKLETPEKIFLAFGSTGTAVGLALGCQLSKLPTHVVGVRVVERIVSNLRKARSVAKQTAQKLQEVEGSIQFDFRQLPLSLLHGFLGKGYGHSTEDAERACLLANQAGLTLETTYTAKALAGLLSQRAQLSGKTIVFWNTYAGT